MSMPAPLHPEPARTCETGDARGGLPSLAVLALLLGAAAGLVGAAFRLALDRADAVRNAILESTHEAGAVGLLLVMSLAAATTALAAWLVHRLEPRAKGSGIPSVEAVLRGEPPPAPLRLIAVKFCGGVLSIGSGLALGREGPSVQMGASLAHLLGAWFRRKRVDEMALMAAGAGAGLATAFNAPVAGAVFVLEELVRRFHTRTTLTTLCASAGAIAVARLFLGDGPDFRVEPLSYPGFGTVPFYLTLGAFMGVFGALTITQSSALLPCRSGSAGRWSCAALVGAAVGALAWWWPDLVGGGDLLTQRTLGGQEPLYFLLLVALFRFGFGAVCYSSGTPGGLFAPLLVVEAQSGFLVGALCCYCFPGLVSSPTAFAVVGMAAFFTAVVRAPVTGIVLITEMTGSFTLLLPLLLSSFTAMLVPTLLGVAPIYDLLREPVTPPPDDSAVAQERTARREP